MLKKIIKRVTSKKNKQYITGAHSIKGRKSHQEDAFYISENKGGNKLILVADGVGGHGHGDFASKETIGIFNNFFVQSDNFKNIPDFLRKTTLASAALVLQKAIVDPRYKNCGTTITGFFITNNEFYTLNVGDSRVYRYARNELKQLTKDHSLIQNMIERGEITAEDAKHHPKRNIMTSAIGQPISLMKIDIEGPFDIEHGEMLLAFSDGVHDFLSNKELTQLIKTNFKNENLAQKLVNSAYANGSIDNITACYYIH